MTDRHRAGFAVLLFLAAILAAGGCLEVAGGQLASGVLAFGAAALGVVTALLMRLNWQLLELNRTILEQDARLLAERATQQSSLPPQ